MKACDHLRFMASLYRNDASTQQLDSSPFLDMHVRVKPTVGSRRILPVAIGVPLLLGLIAVLR